MFKEILSLFIASYLNFVNLALAQVSETETEEVVDDFSNYYNSLEQKLGQNETIRRLNFSQSDPVVVRVEVVDKNTGCPVDAEVELLKEDGRVRKIYTVDIGKRMLYCPYLTKCEDGIAVFSISKDDLNLNKIKIRAQGYYFFKESFPLSTLLKYIHNPLSKPLPDSIRKKLKFEYDWKNATVFNVPFSNKDYYLFQVSDFIKKVSNWNINQYVNEYQAIIFYSKFLGKQAMHLLSNFHILIPSKIKIKRIPLEIKIKN